METGGMDAAVHESYHKIGVRTGVQLTHVPLGYSNALQIERRVVLTHHKKCRCSTRACASWFWELGPCRCRACAPSQPSTWPSPASACQPVWPCTPCSDPSSHPLYPPPAWASSYPSLIASCRSATQLMLQGSFMSGICEHACFLVLLQSVVVCSAWSVLLYMSHG